MQLPTLSSSTFFAVILGVAGSTTAVALSSLVFGPIFQSPVVHETLATVVVPMFLGG